MARSRARRMRSRESERKWVREEMNPPGVSSEGSTNLPWMVWYNTCKKVECDISTALSHDGYDKFNRFEYTQSWSGEEWNVSVGRLSVVDTRS